MGMLYCPEASMYMAPLPTAHDWLELSPFMGYDMMCYTWSTIEGGITTQTINRYI